MLFDSGADFSLAQFDGNKTPFSNCTFKTDSWGGAGKPIDVLFEGTVFEGSGMPFPECSMSGQRVSFENTSFESSALNLRIHRSGGDVSEFKGLSISTDEICLTNISFNGHFDYHQDPKDKHFAPRVDLQRLMFSSMAAVAFTEANLENARFTYSVIDNVNFIDCEWAREPKDKGRKILFDDLSPVDDVSKWEVLRQYVQLKKNFENQKDFVGAGDWSYREMEWRDKLAKRPAYKMGMWLYGFFTDYGENSLKPFGWLVGVWVAAALLYLMIGIPLDNGNSELNYDLGSDGPFRWCDILLALKFSALAMALQLGKSVDLVGWCGTWAYVLHILLTVTLVPLFLLAVRRKFRR